MSKVKLGARNPGLYPVPVVLVTCAAPGVRPNVITIAWTGILASEPPTVYVSIRPSRHSHALVAESGEFVINVPPVSLLRQTDLCGVTSGREADKFERFGLTPVPASQVSVPLIAECPVCIECRVVQTLRLGTHDVFVGRVLEVHADEAVLSESGSVDYAAADPFCFTLGDYRPLGRTIGHYGYTAGDPDGA